MREVPEEYGLRIFEGKRKSTDESCLGIFTAIAEYAAYFLLLIFILPNKNLH